jgi:GNAT superfamily N-acetyltransferase
MPTKIRQLSPEEIAQLTPQNFMMAPIFDRLAHYAGMKGAIFLAETDGERSGCAAVSYSGAGAGAAKGTLHIDQFVVMPEFRGHGLGGRLMKVILDHAKSLSVGKITAEIPGWCPEWRAFYARFGFVMTNLKTANSMSEETPVELRLD